MIGTDDRGRLAPGKLADVVVFAGDPLANIAILEKAMLDGKKFDRAALKPPSNDRWAS